MIQSDVFFGNPTKNYKQMEINIFHAMKENPDVIILPELWSTGYDLLNSINHSDNNCCKTKKFFSSLSKKYNVNIVGGSVLKKTDKGITNTLLCFDKAGTCVSEYDKVHLFGLMNENKYLLAGNKPNLFNLEKEKSAALICYDIRFPEWIRKHTISGAKIIYIVAQWPLERVNHWKTILICRAIENQCYIVACNRSGNDPDNVFAGNSMIVDPWGKILIEAGTKPSICSTEIDLTVVDTIRKKIPIFEDRRTDLY